RPTQTPRDTPRGDQDEHGREAGFHAAPSTRGRPLLPGGGGLSLLASVPSLETEGGGVALADVRAPRGSTPSPRFSKLAWRLAERNGPPPPAGRESRLGFASCIMTTR